MATQTTNLGLTLPIGTEHVSRAIINENNQKIDDEFGTLSEQITNIKIRESNSISKSITSSDEGGTIATSYQEPAPQGYTLIARSFVRTDDGGYGVIVVPSMATNTLIYKSVGSTPTLTGYVRDVWAKNYET